MGAANRIFSAFRVAVSNTEGLAEADRTGLLAALESEIAKEPPPVLAIIGGLALVSPQHSIPSSMQGPLSATRRPPPRTPMASMFRSSTTKAIAETSGFLTFRDSERRQSAVRLADI